MKVFITDQHQQRICPFIEFIECCKLTSSSILKHLSKMLTLKTNNWQNPQQQIKRITK